MVRPVLDANLEGTGSRVIDRDILGPPRAVPRSDAIVS